MGVCFVAYAVSDANIEGVLADPPLVWRVIEADDDSGAYQRELNRASTPSLWGRLLGRPRPKPEVRHLQFTEHELRVVDLDKSWDGLRACLKVCAPLAPPFFDGSGEVGKIEVGYGVALYHRSDVMRQIAQAYAALGDAELLAAFRSADLSGAYPSGLWNPDEADVVSYLTENFAELQAFLRHTQAHGLGAILQFT